MNVRITQGPARCAALLVTVVACSPLAASAQQLTSREAPRRSASENLIEEIESSGRVAVGRIGNVRKLDLHGYSAAIWAEAILGPKGLGFEPGTPIPMAWEELSTGRPPRFHDLQRLLVCLTSLPTASLWRERLPDPSERRQMRAVAAGGECYLHDPVEQDVALVDQYLGLTPPERSQAAGVTLLLTLVEQAALPLALGAATKLASIEDWRELLTADGAAQLTGALLRKDADGALVTALLELAEPADKGQRFEVLARVLRRSLRDGSVPPPHFFDALGAAALELSQAEQELLLARPEAAYRAALARHPSRAEAPTTLRTLVADDPAPAVRAAAIERLLAIEGDAALPILVRALSDADPLVRNTAARGAGSLGAPGVSALRNVIFALGGPGSPSPKHTSGSGSAIEITHARAAVADAQRAALGGLGVAGRAGRKVLIEVARTHPDESMKRLATIALGFSHNPH